MKIKFRVLFDASHLEFFFPRKRSYSSWFFNDRCDISRTGEKHQNRGQILPCVVSWSSTCHLGKGPEQHNYPHDPEATLPVPLLSFFEASTLSFLAFLFSLSHIATIRKHIPARLFPLNVNLLTSGLYATLHTLSFISVWQLQSQREFLYLSSIFHFSLFHRPSLPLRVNYTTSFFPAPHFFAPFFESIKYWHKQGRQIAIMTDRHKLVYGDLS